LCIRMLNKHDVVIKINNTRVLSSY